MFFPVGTAGKEPPSQNKFVEYGIRLGCRKTLDPCMVCDIFFFRKLDGIVRSSRYVYAPNGSLTHKDFKMTHAI